MGTPTVSVLIPVFNGEHFLPECLDSVLGQDFTDMEILLANDGSSDGSVNLIKRYAAKDRRIRWWDNPRNLGLSGNFNCCLRAAQGEYIKFVLQDDKLLSPATVRLMVTELDQNPGVSLTGSAAQIMDEHSQILEIRKSFKQGIQDGLKTARRCLEGTTNFIGEPSVVMFRRAQAGRGFDEDFRQLVDLEMWIHLLSKGQFAYFSEPLCGFRRHRKQQTEVNRRRIPTGTEELMLLGKYYRDPWFQPAIDGKFLFTNIRSLRRHPTSQSHNFFHQMQQDLGPRRYFAFSLRRKLTRPFEKLAHRIKRHWNRRLKVSVHPGPASDAGGKQPPFSASER